MSSIPCNNCRRSKKKCSREKPCSLCKLQSVECIYNKSNPYKKRNTNKIAKIFYRADKLESVLKSALEKDYKFANLHIKHIIDHWNHVKLGMTSYSDLNIPIALAWSKIKDSISSRSVKSFALVKRADKYQDYLVLYNIYVTYLHPHYPFINPQRILMLLELSQYDNPLLTSTLCRAQLFWFAMNNYKIPNLEEMELYRASVRENAKNEGNISLEAVQVNINLALVEIHMYQIASLNKHLITAIYMSHQLGLHDLQSVTMDEEYEEKECAWSLLTWLDFIVHMLLCQPRLFNADSNFRIDPYPSSINHDKDKIFSSASSYVMRRYVSCVSLNWDFPKNIKDFQFNTVSECRAQHFIEMLSRVKTYVDIDMDLDLVKEPNTIGSTANLWRLAQFVKCCVLIIDICELLGKHYRGKVEIRRKYLKVQHEYSVKLIEAMFPQVTNSGATNIKYFEFIDPLYAIAAFHACKILLEDKVAISKEYFSYSYEHCVKSFKLFKCNWAMEKFFTHFDNHSYLIQLKKELKIHKSYVSSSSSPSYSSPFPYDIYFQDTS